MEAASVVNAVQAMTARRRSWAGFPHARFLLAIALRSLTAQLGRGGIVLESHFRQAAISRGAPQILERAISEVLEPPYAERPLYDEIKCDGEY
jgi:hypothetical protein